MGRVDLSCGIDPQGFAPVRVQRIRVTGEAFEREALDELVDYTKTHFKFEEDMMEQNGYPEFTTHRAEHELMIARVEEVLKQYQQDQDTAMQNAIDFLQEWLINHINGTDKQYSRFLIDKGVK